MSFGELIPIVSIIVGAMIPLVAIIGGITAGIIKSNARHRLLELAQRERIVALERGIDPDRLPKIELPTGNGDSLTFEQKQQRRSELLRIWGFITVGFGLAIFVGIGLADGFREAGPALMFPGVGLALLVSGYVVKSGPNETRTGV